MATDLVLVSPTSTEMIFSGNMYKAPPLDRKKRKKWHERFFVLRANRTLELYKSLKAAESHKTPRRIIDLRECISLEIGLEYRNYEHILSLGTFKRTFFFAAPSDALMLQWANVLEKTKSAQDGESIEVLDIGLRKNAVVPVVHRVKPSSPNQRFSGSPKRIAHKPIDSKGALSVGLFPQSRDSSESLPFRDSDVQGKGARRPTDGAISRQRASSFSSSFESSSNNGSQKRNSKSRPKSPHRVPLLLKPQLSSDSYDSQSSRATSTASQSEVGHFERPLSQSSQQSFNVSPNRTSSSSHTTSPLISSRVPPPANILAPATRTKDGFFVVENRNSGHSETGDHESRDSAGEKTSDKSKESPSKSREFVVRDGALQRSKPGRNVIKIPKSKLTNEKKAEKSQPGLSSKFLAMRSTPINNLSTAGNFESNMKRSFRYRMITLRPEKPIFVDNGEENSESEDEGEEASGATKARRKRHVSLTRKAPVNNKSPHTSPKRQAKQTKADTPVQSEEEFLDTDPIEVPARPTPLPRQGGQPRTNGYSRVQVMGVKKTQSTDLTVAVPAIIAAKLNVKPRKRSSSQSDAVVPSLKDQTMHMKSLSQDDILYEETINDNAAAAQMNTGMSLEEVDVFDVLPARPPSNGFDMYASTTSINSLDNILVEPPPMFSEGSNMTENVFDYNIQLDSPELKTKSELSEKDSSQQVRMQKPVPKERKRRDNHQARQSLDDVFSPPPVDRSSTESNDTGYTSAVSPSAIAEEKSSSEATIQEFKLKFEDDYDADHECTDVSSFAIPMGATNRDRGKPLGVDKQSSLQLSQASIASTVSDYVRFYSPIIFYKPGSARDGTRLSLNRSSPTTSGSNVFSLLVCLAEDSDEIIKDLISFKSQEGYTVVECDEIQGSSNVSTLGDDFTVETALEDLEFGFTVIKSTQKDIFMRKVREFNFEIQRLFGSSKPFSCDVVVKHTDEITVLSIEVDMKS